MDPPRLCLNCEQPLLERYCSHCGQDSRNHARSLGGVLHELVESLIHLDSAFYVGNCEQAHVDGGRELSRALWEAIPKAFFLLVPVFALLTRILFAREGRFYVEHLVFITYLHSGLFLAGTLIALASLLIGFAPTSMTHLAGVTQVTLSCVLVLYGCVYIVRAVRRVFQQAWWLTLVKSVVLLGAYAFLVTLSLVGVIVLTLGTR